MSSTWRSESVRPNGLGAYFGVPLILGFAVGVHQGGFGRYFSPWGSLVVWEVHFFIFWACALLAAALLSRVPRLNSAPMLVRLISAALLGVVISRPIFWVTYQLRTAYAMQLGASADAVARPIQIFDFSLQFALLILQLYGPNVLMWTVCSLALSRYVYIPFISSDVAGEESYRPIGAPAPRTEQGAHFSTDPAPGWMSRIKPEIGRKLRWLKAEGHYVRVRTDLGTDLIHYRLSDAVEQLPLLGLQVHRSYWVSFDALRDPQTRIENGIIKLIGDEAIPIGPTYLVKVREAQGSASSPALKRGQQTSA